MIQSKIELENGKYTVVCNNGSIKVLRHGRSWRDETGDSFISAMVKRLMRLESALKTKDHKHMSQSFVGKRLNDMFCNGFFGRDTYDLSDAEILRIFEEDEKIIVVVRKTNGSVDYGYFDSDWNNWETVYEYLEEWVNS